MEGMNKAMKILSGMTSPGYMMRDCTQLMAEVKASNMDEAAKTEIMNFAQKSMDADLKRSEAAIALVRKYNTPENIEPADPDDEDGFY